VIQASFTVGVRSTRVAHESPPTLTVVVPTLDEAPHVVALLSAVHEQLAPGDEVLVVDGGSQDGTLQLARDTGLPQLRCLESRRGRARQMNAGAEAARGEWLLFLHADSTINAGGFEGLRRCLSRDAARWGHFRVQIHDRAAIFRWIEFGLNLRSRAFSTPSGDQGVFVRRDLFEAVGGYDDEAPFMEDLILADRLRAQTAPEPPVGWLGTSARRWRRDGVLRTVLQMWGLRAAFRLGVSPRRLAAYYRFAGHRPSVFARPGLS
jgi:rSAM/selenodomain-associated transferase 2